MIATLSFLLKISVTAISFYWRNDTLTFVTWWSSSPNQFNPEIFSPLPCSSRFVCNKLLFVYFFKELISFIGSLNWQMPHQHFQWFDYVSGVSFESTVGKEEIAHCEQFLLFPKCFLPIWRIFCHFHQIWNCRLQTLSTWKSLEFVVWERVKDCLRSVLIPWSLQHNPDF